jgi:hypothetical protein
VYINHRQILAFLDIKNYKADIICDGPGKLKNNFVKILFQGAMR